MMKIIYALIFLNSLLIFSQIPAKIIAIKDGDTVVALLNNNTQETLRLADVDCPEKRQPFGKNAKQFTSSQVFGKNITFTESAKTDTEEQLPKYSMMTTNTFPQKS